VSHDLYDVLCLSRFGLILILILRADSLSLWRSWPTLISRVEVFVFAYIKVFVLDVYSYQLVVVVGTGTVECWERFVFE